MPLVEIKSYALGWNPKTKEGSLRIKLANGQDYPVPVSSAAELAALAAILNESPIGLNTDTGFIMTPTWEPVGGT
jgi:hypothetical protein